MPQFMLRWRINLKNVLILIVSFLTLFGCATNKLANEAIELNHNTIPAIMTVHAPLQRNRFTVNSWFSTSTRCADKKQLETLTFAGRQNKAVSKELGKLPLDETVNLHVRITRRDVNGDRNFFDYEYNFKVNEAQYYGILLNFEPSMLNGTAYQSIFYSPVGATTNDKLLPVTGLSKGRKCISQNS